MALAGLSACQTTPSSEVVKEIQVIKANTEELKRYHQQNHDEYLQKIQRTIRNEIVPEMREISLLSKKTRKKQLLAKGSASKKIVVGRVEWVELLTGNIKLKARVDTGAQTSSLHAVKVKETTRDGEDYVEFVTVDDHGKEYTMLEKVVKKTKVRGTSGRARSRYVVKMSIQFGGKVLDTVVNLNNRSKLRHKFLIGRNILIGDYIVDVSQSRLLGEENEF